MMNNDRTFEREEGRLLAAALKAREFRQPLPKGMGERLRARVRAAEGGGRRWWKVAASVAAVASFAAFAATVAVKLAGDDETGGTGESNEPGVTQSAADETFEEIFSEELAELEKQEEKQAMNTRAVKGLAAGALVAATAFTVPSAQGAVRGSVFDDVKVWYKGSAGNAVGTADSSGNQVGKMKNLPQLSNTSSSMHGGSYYWWGWRMSYENQPVYCPYANTTLDSTPCMVIASPVTTNSTETVTINGEETTQPNITYRCGDLHFSNWMEDRDSVCENYTLVLRFRNESINPVPGNQNRAIQIGSVWTSTAGYAAGMDLRLNPQEALGKYYSPRIVVGNNQQEFKNIRIQDNRWVDCPTAVSGQNLVATFCWSDGASNAIARVTYTYPTSGPQPAIAANCTTRIGGNNSASSTFTRGVELAQSSWTYGFRGVFHQIAFWDRTLSDDEIREAMAAGTGRPNLVHVGMEGNGIAEFATSDQTTSVSNTGAWEYLNPTLSAENPTATISFTCPALWAGLPQWLRIPIASTSSSGTVNIALGNENLGTVNITAGHTACVYVEEGKIASGANTLTISRVNGDSIVLDAVTLGGSWKFGENNSSFSSESINSSLPGKIGPDCWVFNPACGNDKFHARGTTWSINGDKFSFPFFVPADLIGKFRGELMFKTQTAADSGGLFSSEINGTALRGETSYAQYTQYSSRVQADAFVAGWNEAVWNRKAYWVNFDTWQFTLLPPPKKGMMIIIK